jgi:hypothetical protein
MSNWGRNAQECRSALSKLCPKNYPHYPYDLWGSCQGDSDRKWCQHANNVHKGQVFKIKKYFSGFDVPIIFSNSDFGTVYFSHDDALVLALKMRFVGRNPRPWVKRILVDIKLHKYIVQVYFRSNGFVDRQSLPNPNIFGDLLGWHIIFSWYCPIGSALWFCLVHNILTVDVSGGRCVFDV